MALTKFAKAHVFSVATAIVLSVCGPTVVRAQSFASDATSPGEASVGATLDSVDPASGPYADIIGAVGSLSTSQARSDALGQLTPRAYRLMPRLAIQSMDMTDRDIRGYLGQRREAMLDASPGVPVHGDRTINVRFSYGLKQGKYKARPDRPRANFDSRAISAGLDVTPLPGLIVGAAIGIDGIDANLDRSQDPRSTVFNAGVTPYASYTNGRFYVDATASYTRSWYQLRRQVAFTGFNDRLQAGPNGDSAAGTVEAGALVKLGAVRVQPFAGMLYRYADLGGLVESGGSAALAVAKFKTESVRTSLGARATATIRKGAWTLRPSLEAQWQRELRSHPDSRIEAIFLNGGTPIFTLPAARYDRDGAIVGAGLTALHGERTAIRVSYIGEFGNDRRINGFAITANRRF